MSERKTSIGLTPNLTAVLAYLIGFISGIIIYVVEKENRFVKFHAIQSILLFVGFLVLSIVAGLIPVIHGVLLWVLQIAWFICWIVAIIKASQGQYFKFPVIGDLAEKQL